MTAIPLTTTYTPAPTCTLDIYTAGIYYSIGGPSPSVCFPSAWESTSQYFSPGLCPTGYTQACETAVTAGTVTETQATCCPTYAALPMLPNIHPIRQSSLLEIAELTERRGYACYTQRAFNFPGQACASIFLSETTTTVTNASNNEPMLATFHPKTEAVNGYGVSIRYQSTDFISTTSGSSPSTSSSPSSLPTSTSLTASPTNLGSSSTSATAAASPGLSTGAKAGIGVGAAVVGLAVLVGIAMLFRSRRSKVRSKEGYVQEVDGTSSAPRYEASGDTMTPQKKAREIYMPPAELGGSDVTRQ